MTVMKLIRSPSCAPMLSALAYGAKASLRAAVRNATRTGSPENTRSAAVRVGTGG